jgi:tRNA threonylcarbamoyladenosine biosynthesis protein TsaB
LSGLIILALDTTARSGSLALARDGVVVDEVAGDPARTHGERLPGDVVALLDRHGLTPAAVDLYAVAAGPGSFTGLRVGIATVQGFALAAGRLVVAVSTLDALAHLAHPRAAGRLTGALVDAQRGEVFSALYEAAREIEPPAVGAPAATLDRWRLEVQARGAVVAGDGAIRYRALVEACLGARAEVLEPLPPLARAVAEIAAVRAARGAAVPPHAIVPIYVRRPDAELARDRPS